MLHEMGIARWVWMSVAAAALGLMVAGCGQAAASKPDAAAAGAEASAAPAKSGVQLWAEQCGRCHNLRDPAWRTAAEREVALRHMRMRVPLTGEDERAIREFLSAR